MSRYSHERASNTDTEEKKLFNKVIIFDLIEPDVTWTTLTMSYLAHVRRVAVYAGSEDKQV